MITSYEKKFGEQVHDQVYGDPILLKKKLFHFHYCASICVCSTPSFYF